MVGQGLRLVLLSRQEARGQEAVVLLVVLRGCQQRQGVVICWRMVILVGAGVESVAVGGCSLMVGLPGIGVHLCCQPSDLRQ